jgi:hypothetical protein
MTERIDVPQHSPGDVRTQTYQVSTCRPAPALALWRVAGFIVAAAPPRTGPATPPGAPSIRVGQGTQLSVDELLRGNPLREAPRVVDLEFAVLIVLDHHLVCCG